LLTEDLSSLSAGTYCVTVTDNGPCTETLCVTITEPAGMTINTDTTADPSCNGGNNGLIHITITGGTTPYSYNWTTSDGSGLVNGQEDQDNLTAGTYNLTVTDATGCEKTQSWTLSDPPVLTVTESHSNPTCNNSSNGSIDLTVSGGSGAAGRAWKALF